MRVINICTQMEAGGAQRVAWSLTRGLAGLGHETELLFLYTKRDVYGHFEEVRSLYHRRPGLAGFLRIVFRLLRYLLAERPDAVIAHTHYANVVVLPIAWLAGVRGRIAVAHNPVQTFPGSARLLDRIIGSTRVYGKHVAVSGAVSSSAASYPRAYRTKLNVIYNGVARPPEPLQPSPSLLPQGIPALITVGRLSAQKNQAFLLDLLARLPDIGLVIIGEGELHESLRERAARLGVTDRVRFVGEIEHRAIWAHLAAARVYVFPSLYEAMPLSLVEAMSVGLPIVASDIPANRELLTRSDGSLAGSLVEQGDIEPFAQAVMRTLNDKPFSDRMRESAKARAADFGLSTMINNYDALLARKGGLHAEPVQA